MNNRIHRAWVFLAILCLCPPAYSQSDDKNIQDAEMKFSIQMTAALNNDPKGQFLVAEMYEKGVGTPQNLRMAHLWYTKSANQKYAPAIKRLSSWGSESQLTDAARERADAQKRRQAEAEAAATTVINAAQAADTAPVAKEKPVEMSRPKDKPKGATQKNAEKGEVEFKANPCNTPTAKFTSTCQ
jgi:colicin import membrane protein